MRNSVGYLVSFMTKDRVLRDLNQTKTMQGEIIAKARRMLQRILLIRLHLRQTYFLNLMKNNTEALESARQAREEAALVCLDTVQLGLIVARKMEFLRQQRINSHWGKEHEFHDMPGSAIGGRINIEAEIKLLKRLARSSTGMSSKIPATLARGFPRPGITQTIFTDKQRQVVEHLRNFIPICLELKRLIEGQGEQWHAHRKIKQIESLQQAVKELPLEDLNMTYLYRNMPEEHYLFRQTVPDIIRLSLLELRDMDFEVDSDTALYQISSQSLAEKISWLAISTYCMAIEKSFVESSFTSPHAYPAGKDNKLASLNASDQRVPDSEVDLGKALELAYLFLPEQMPWVIGIFKLYEKTKDAINLSIVGR